MTLTNHQLLIANIIAYGSDQRSGILKYEATQQLNLVGSVSILEAGNLEIDACYIAETSEEILLVFRGTALPSNGLVSVFKDWGNNFVIHSVEDKHFKGRVHQGYRDSLNNLIEQGLIEIVQERVSRTNKPLLITGYSKGGALAPLAAMRLCPEYIPIKNVRVKIFAAPKCGDETFVSAFNQMFPDTQRYEYQNDIIPHYPFDRQFHDQVLDPILNAKPTYGAQLNRWILGGVLNFLWKPKMDSRTQYKPVGTLTYVKSIPKKSKIEGCTQAIVKTDYLFEDSPELYTERLNTLKVKIDHWKSRVIPITDHFPEGFFQVLSDDQNPFENLELMLPQLTLFCSKERDVDTHLDFDDSFSPEYGSHINFNRILGFHVQKALELTNLVRIAYRDYELCETYQRRKRIDSKDLERLKGNILRKNRYLSTSTKINAWRLDKYKVPEENQPISENRNYKIIDTFCYTSFHPFPGFKDFLSHNTSRFGFMAETQKEDGTKDLYIIFRGTREIAEWINNFQPYQIQALAHHSTEIQAASSGAMVHWGFNKFYTSFHPGPFWNIHSPLGRIAHRVLSFSGKLYRSLVLMRWSNPKPNHLINEDLDLKTIQSQKNTLALIGSLEEKIRNENIGSIYLSGHSLGASLATLATYQLAKIVENLNKQTSINLYTIASPRVGNRAFTQAIEQYKNVQVFRIANSEDGVTNGPSASSKMFGPEMIPKKRIDQDDPSYVHVGYPIVFTCNTGYLSSNHNLNATYSLILQEDIQGTTIKH